MSAELDQVIRLLAQAMGCDPAAEPKPKKLRRDPQYLEHRKALLADLRNPDAPALCALDLCDKVAQDGDWCHGHSPDDVAIARAMRGERVSLLPHERLEAARRLKAAGVDDVAKVLHISGSTWHNLRKQIAS